MLVYSQECTSRSQRLTINWKQIWCWEAKVCLQTMMTTSWKLELRTETIAWCLMCWWMSTLRQSWWWAINPTTMHLTRLLLLNYLTYPQKKRCKGHDITLQPWLSKISSQLTMRRRIVIQLLTAFSLTIPNLGLVRMELQMDRLKQKWRITHMGSCGISKSTGLVFAETSGINMAGDSRQPPLNCSTSYARTISSCQHLVKLSQLPLACLVLLPCPWVFDIFCQSRTPRCQTILSKTCTIRVWMRTLLSTLANSEAFAPLHWAP
mmetsp:Transcript_7065/g.19779  ORF Transcript_7065/g.19779 Transcript_7065/m.19779 type:complete len:264 (+) Transcript_7065:1330-2121(+)